MSRVAAASPRPQSWKPDLEFNKGRFSIPDKNNLGPDPGGTPFLLGGAAAVYDQFASRHK